ncbi:hypothetical protein PR202_gb29647 [Eleusine coracana subsp. coracana]|uniref:Uncharacterized protein n=1 Tax=Eleusine coracana subsp. coracana TaxID=191504 RepID=A0AAV5FZE5_ELECO|nr:hypothetical protein PR202_gb29647 [Eleusine coracana subsp. coracana]
MADGTTLTNTSSSPAAAVSTFPKGKTKDEWIEFFEESDRATQEMNARWGDGRPPDGIIRACVLPNSSHRDGSIYSDTEGWHQEYRIADTTESNSIGANDLLKPDQMLPESRILYHSSFWANVANLLSETGFSFIALL